MVVVAALAAHFGAALSAGAGPGAEPGRLAGGPGPAQPPGHHPGRPSSPTSGDFFVVVVAAAIVLGMLGIDLTPLLASATIIGATIGFGAQSLVRDYLSGILLTMEDQFGIGDTIVVGGASGVVEDLSFRVTRLRAPTGRLVRAQRRHPPAHQLLSRLGQGRGRHRRGPRGHRGLRAGPRAVAAARPGGRPPPKFAAALHRAPRGARGGGRRGRHLHVRLALRTTPARRVALERALREEVLAGLADEGLWPANGPAGGDG